MKTAMNNFTPKDAENNEFVGVNLYFHISPQRFLVMKPPLLTYKSLPLI